MLNFLLEYLFFIITVINHATNRPISPYHIVNAWAFYLASTFHNLVILMEIVWTPLKGFQHYTHQNTSKCFNLGSLQV